ncbi:serine hydrolase [Micromonospora craniellae]|uniref:serine hydrolase n=1 Tax=Micromonospora craniellae TaxID=2294034 RepID=UPI001CC6911E|nr:serine hydrolase [Micromonospora craniellae]
MRTAYRRERTRAGGDWQAYVSLAGPDGPLVAVDESAEQRVAAYSVNKIAVAAAVLDTVDRGLLALDQRVEVTAELARPGGDGIFGLDGAYPSQVTLGHVLANLLTVSDDAAVRLCALVCPATEVNRILAAKGFPHTQVRPVGDSPRFHLGTSTARETHDLLWALVGGTLLSPGSTEFVLRLLRSPVAYTDGVRRTMSSAERARIATKAGWFGDARHEAGVICDTTGAPRLTYAFFAAGQPGADDFGATHAAVQARARLGRRLLDLTDRLAAREPHSHRPGNSG